MKQTEIGKAFEYACVNAFYEKYRDVQNVIMEESPQMRTARGFFEKVDGMKKNDLNYAAEAARKIIERLEPRLLYSDQNSPLILTIQTDSQGMSGDVRDILCIRQQNKWQIGLSCKHNHHAVKHSRLSDKIDFGKEWFGKNCSKAYFSEVLPLFTCLREIKNDSKDIGIPKLWKDIDDKFEKYYKPILQAFMKELKSLDKKYPNEIPKLLISYLVGKYDFYKVITDDRHKTTRVEAVNIAGTMNKQGDGHEAITKVPLLKMPSRFYHIDFKVGSMNTIEVVCDEGWTVSMRLHNASSKVEPSLKFDVNLISVPASIHAQIEPWDIDEANNTKHRMIAEEKSIYIIETQNEKKKMD